MPGEADGGYPRLTENEIMKIDYIFLTHSHIDHSGAIPWIESQGFKGIVVGTKETLNQLPFEVKRKQALDKFIKEEHPIKVNYVHEIDLIRDKKADIAVIDCAYGYDQTSFRKYTTC